MKEKRKPGRFLLGILLSLVLMITAIPAAAAGNSYNPPPQWVQAARQLQLQMNAKAEAKDTPTYGSTEIDDIDYIGDGSEFHLLDVYSPKGATVEQKLPVIVELHGGGYLTGNKEINRQHGLFFASQGFRVVNINYPLPPEATIAETMQDISRVFQWIENNQDKYGFDARNIFLTGDSSGGHMVLIFSAAQTDPELQNYLGIRPSKGYRATAATCPMGSFTAKDLRSFGITEVLALGADFRERNNCEILSYESFDKPTLPPVFLVTTPSDITAYPVTKAIHEDMVKKNVPHQYKEYRNSTNTLPHVFNVTKPDLKESIQANQDICNFFRSNSSR